MEFKPIIEQVFHYEGYTCCVVFYPLGHRCGYVLVPHTHLLYEKDYEECCISCHGGLSYSSHELCGTTYSGWWIGFDCAHAGDLLDLKTRNKYYGEIEQDSFLDTMQWLTGVNSEEFGTVKNLDFCMQECRNIVDQLVEME